MDPPSAKRRRIDVIEHQVQSEILQPEMAWNNDLNPYYNVSWGFETSEMDAVEWSELSHSPKKSTKCPMCGIEGHAANVCPSSCCLKCGEKTDTFQDECAKCLPWSLLVCEICECQGHSKNNCPNHWKCYHSTIDTPSTPAYLMFENPLNNGTRLYECFLNTTNEFSSKNWS